MSEPLARVLDGRQAWYEHKLAHVAEAPSSTWIELGLNIPGWPKTPPWAESVFAEGSAGIVATADARCVARLCNDAGHFGLFVSPLPARAAKLRAVELERAHPWGRLWDMDCRGPRGPITRRSLGLAERMCLACHAPHDACIGTDRHSLPDLRRAAEAIAARPLVHSWKSS